MLLAAVRHFRCGCGLASLRSQQGAKTMPVDELLTTHDATGLAELIRRGDVSPPELVEASIARIEQVNPKINAVVAKLYEQARRDAQNVDTSAPFAGVPIAIKDLMTAMKGVPVTNGSRMPATVADHDALVVTRFREMGFIPVVTSTSPELGIRLVTESAAFGITRNPWNTEHTSGGSSGGSASLVAAGAMPVAHASDGGGSIRVPSACCGLVGMKPSRGRVSFSPDAREIWNGYVVQHAVARSVRDSAAVLDGLCGFDPQMPYTAAPPSKGFAAAAKPSSRKMRIGFYRESPLGLPVSPETEAAMDAAIDIARGLGHRVEEIALPMIGRDFFLDFGRVICAAIASDVRFFSGESGRSVEPLLERSTRIVARYGELVSAGELASILMRQNAVSLELLQVTMPYDAVFMPLISSAPVKCGSMDSTGTDLLLEQTVDALRLTRLLKLEPLMNQFIDKAFSLTHWPAIQNVTGQPSISLPVHMTADGLPLGIQAAGRMGEEETLFELAAQMEKASGWLDRRSPLARSAN
jgi:amidase